MSRLRASLHLTGQILSGRPARCSLTKRQLTHGRSRHAPRSSSPSQLKIQIPATARQYTITQSNQQAPHQSRQYTPTQPMVQLKDHGLHKPFPNSEAEFTHRLYFTSPEDFQPIPIYTVMDINGFIIDPAEDPKLSRAEVIHMYKNMTILNIMDCLLNDAQKKGRISFYLTNNGEEGLQIGSSHALNPADLIFAQYREAGVLLHRGYPIEGLMDQCYGTKDDTQKGRAMPLQYGSPEHHFVTISCPLTTKLPQAAGAAYAYKRAGKKLCVVCYFGDGAASGGDAQAGFNFAAVLDCPVLYFCRNNGYSVSTPTCEQYRGDGIAVRGPAYGMKTVRVDGNDVFAVYNVTKAAREYCVKENKPIIVEAMTYRIDHHSTNDDSSIYRETEDVSKWVNEYHPIRRLRLYMENQDWWTKEDDEAWYKEATAQVLQTFNEVDTKIKPSPVNIFSDVYDEMTTNLTRQLNDMKRHVEKYPENYPTDDFLPIK